MLDDIKRQIADMFIPLLLLGVVLLLIFGMLVAITIKDMEANHTAREAMRLGYEQVSATQKTVFRKTQGSKDDDN